MITFLTQLISLKGSEPAHEVAPGAASEVLEATEHMPEVVDSGFSLSNLVSHHLSDAVLWHFEVGGIDLSITKRVVMMWISAALMFMVFIPAARIIAKNGFKKPTRFTGMVEVLVNFIRHDVGEATMGHHSKSYEPYLLTLFFFVLFGNLLGLIPSLGEIANLVLVLFGSSSGAEHELPLVVKLWPGTTPTGDIGVTATLAVFSFLAILLSGFAYQGVAFIKNIVPAGIPILIWPLMWVIEAIGMITKPFALAIRLLANMTAGHMIILVFLGFIFQFQSYSVIPVSIAGSVAIYLLEIFVAFLQAYIFVFLTALFVAGAQHRH